MAVQKKDSSSIEYTQINAITGDSYKDRYLYYQLKLAITKAKSIDIIVSFLMESGVRMLLKDLRGALDRGVHIRILTGNYLGITQPSALYLIKRELGDSVDLRFYNDKNRSFHPKAYIFHYGENNGDIFIGSSNVSRSALTSGIEWNYRIRSSVDIDNFEIFQGTFNDLFENHSIVIDDKELKRYSKNWHKPAVSKDLARYDNDENENENDNEIAGIDNNIERNGLDGENASMNVTEIFRPRGAQIEALYALEDTRAEGANKALVFAATGVGKTFLAAFDSLNYKTVLFVAHREEILKQAEKTFRCVRPNDETGFFNGEEKITDKPLTFASVSTLGKEEYLNENYFKKDHFDLVIIDEAHHMCAGQYMKIINYFTPQFLLGLTATPDRMDGKNIYEICDYNVAYEISLKEAINKGMLVPFHYYGIYDETDYDGLKLVGGHYREEDLDKKYIDNKYRYELIYKYYKKYLSSRALGFCCSRKHAEAMAENFCKRGVPSAAVYSEALGNYHMDREEAINKLRNKEINVIFVVDMFNEGVDIKELDMVMFLRPTESPIVFLQQLGRGLRISKGKEYLNVLDFIGNYEKAGKAPLLLSGGTSFEKKNGSGADNTDIEYPDDCLVDFDMRLIDLFKELEQRNMSIKDRINKEFYRVKEQLEGKVPTRMELFTYMDDDVYELCMKNAKLNPFKRYMEYLHEINELNDKEQQVYDSCGREFIAQIETTSMTKVYKMPILYAFYNDGNVRMALTDEELLQAWKKFFNTGTNWKDLKTNITYDEYKKITDKQHISNIKKNPVKFLKESSGKLNQGGGKGYFVDKEGYTIAVREELARIVENEAFRQQMRDVIEYRTMEYYRRRYEKR